MTDFFPIATNVDGLWLTSGGLHHRSVRNEPRFHEIAAERDYARLVAAKWADDAERDGWLSRPTYRHESITTACTLEREGYTAHVIARPSYFDPRWTLGGGEVYVWAHDHLQIPVPLVYPGWQYFVDAPVTCPHCHRGPNRMYLAKPPHTDAKALAPVATVNYSFAGRACEECAPALRAATEKPGWND